MSYDALTIDAQTFYENGRHLDRGLLAQLSQFRDGPIDFIVSTVVLHEIRKALQEKAQAPIEALTKAHRDGLANGQLAKEQAQSLKATLDEMASAKDHAEAQLKEFVEATGAEVITVDKVSLKEILASYFGKRPPFSTKGKKDEFPDAITLTSLEIWAKENKKKLLAVSKDGDWKAFAEHAEWIDCKEDLGDALATVVAATDAALAQARAILTAISGAGHSDMRASLDGEIERAVEYETPYIEFDGPMQGEEDGVTLVLQSYDLSGADDDFADTEIVRMRADGFVMRTPVKIKATAHVSINFSVYDSIDKDYVPMGSKDVEADVEFDAYLLIDCAHEDDLDADADIATQFEILNAELVGAPPSIDIGYVEYSFAEEDEDF